MKITFLRPLLVAACVGLAVNVYAGTNELLRQAYGELASADHDYKGHRLAAMHKLDEAGRVLGITLHGNDKEHEKQGISDVHLKTAQSLLQEASGSLTGKALKRVQAAEKDITVALSLK